jgi:hypothetical protein
MKVAGIIGVAFTVLLTVGSPLAKGGHLTCYGGKDGTGKILVKKMSSAHNCCRSGRGKSWTCPTYNDGQPVNCSAKKDLECR